MGVGGASAQGQGRGAHAAPSLVPSAETQVLNVRNVLVVVSRWYGGVLLGPDRFKHINNCARSILVERSYAGSPVSAPSPPLPSAGAANARGRAPGSQHPGGVRKLWPASRRQVPGRARWWPVQTLDPQVRRLWSLRSLSQWLPPLRPELSRA